MLKRMWLMATVVVQCSMIAYAVQVGDVVGEDFVEIFSRTERMTVNDVEYLYTFKGMQNFKSIVGEVDNNGNASYTYVRYEDVDTQFVIEKVIPLTGNYDIVVKVRDLLNAGESVWASYYYNDSNGNIECVNSNFYCTESSSIVIGDSCFEDNELVKTVCIEADEVSRGLRIANRSFYGAKNFRYLTVNDVIEKNGSSSDDHPEDFINLHLESIGESAFEGCTSLKLVGCDCSELTRIGKNAFKDCFAFLGLVSSYESLAQVISFGDGDLYMLDKNIFWEQGQIITNELQYVWDTPKLEYLGEYAFYNAGNSSEPFLEWTFRRKEIEIGHSAFYASGFLSEIHFPSAMEKIPENAFIGLNKDRYSCQLYFPDSLACIGDQAFGEASVQVIAWPTTLKEIGYAAFANSCVPVDYEVNSERTGVITNFRYHAFIGLPTSLTNLGTSAFSSSPIIGNRGMPVWSNGKISYLTYSSEFFHSCGPFSGVINFPITLKSVPDSCFAGNSLLENIVLHNSITNIGSYAFQGCSSLNLVVPMSVCELGYDVGALLKLWQGTSLISVPGVKSVVFEGKPPKGIIRSKLLECSQVLVSAEYAAEWAPYMNGNVKFAKKVDGEWVALGGKVISNAMRASDPTIMDIKYKVTSTKDKVNVRILAYKDGVRSFANALPLATFVDGTAANVGDGVAANVEHTVSWQVSKDWDADLAKVSVEVFVMEDNLLPLQLTTIPANNGHPTVTFSRNEQSGEKVMNALYWLYADKTSGLTLENGVLKSGGKQLANGTTLSVGNAVSYIYSRMGYGNLSGDTLQYVNSVTRSDISPSGTISSDGFIKQFAVKEGAAE